MDALNIKGLQHLVVVLLDLNFQTTNVIAPGNKIDVYDVYRGIMQHKTWTSQDRGTLQERCDPTKAFLDSVHLRTLEILNLISDQVINYLTYLMNDIVFVAFPIFENKLLNYY